ncbi:MAG: hypothetical protein H6550_11750 [Chitinophagales bacterium]|nr:hypothetical protein [Chitinophagales bacterium]
METLIFHLEGDDKNGFDASSTVAVGNVYINTTANSKQEIIDNIRMLMNAFQQHEWKDDAYWSTVNIDEIELAFIDYDDEDSSIE